MPKISVVLPCRNEELAIGICIKKIHAALKGKDYEIIVSDFSDDNSGSIAKSLGAKVIKHNKIGYGAALMEGFSHCSGSYVVMADADNTYDFLEIPLFLEKLEKTDFVIGSRFKGKIRKGAMKPLHKIGNPLLNYMFNVLFKTKFSDTHSGFRAFRREMLNRMNLKRKGMDFALEMMIAVAKNKVRYAEVPITYSKRIGKSKLNSFRDGAKHIRFMLSEKFRD